MRTTAADRWRDWVPPGPVAKEPNLVPLFPIAAFSPHSACPHRGPIVMGSAFVCMICMASGKDNHPALQITPADRKTLAEFASGPTKYDPDTTLKGGLG